MAHQRADLVPRGWPGLRRVAGVEKCGQALPDVGQVALVCGVGWVGGSQPLGDGEGGAVVLLGGGVSPAATARSPYNWQFQWSHDRGRTRLETVP